MVEEWRKISRGFLKLLLSNESEIRWKITRYQERIFFKLEWLNKTIEVEILKKKLYSQVRSRINFILERLYISIFFNELQF